MKKSKPISSHHDTHGRRANYLKHKALNSCFTQKLPHITTVTNSCIYSHSVAKTISVKSCLVKVLQIFLF